MKLSAPEHRLHRCRARASAAAASLAVAIVANVCGSRIAAAQDLPAQSAEPTAASPAAELRWFGEVGVGEDTTSGSIGFAGDW